MLMKPNDIAQGQCSHLCSLALHQFHHQSHCHLFQLHEFQQHQQHQHVDLNCHQNQCHYRQPIHQRHVDHLLEVTKQHVHLLYPQYLQFSIFYLFFIISSIILKHVNYAAMRPSVSKTWIIQSSIRYCNNKFIHILKKCFRFSDFPILEHKTFSLNLTLKTYDNEVYCNRSLKHTF